MTERGLDVVVWLSVLAFLVLAVLCGCATLEPAPVATVTNTVSVPVPVACVDLADLPVIPAPVSIAAGATHEQIDAANAADLRALDSYAAVADALLRECSK